MWLVQNGMAFLLQDVQSFTTAAEMEKFLLDHGEQVIDVLGAEVDRIELEIKVRSVWGE